MAPYVWGNEAVDPPLQHALRPQRSTSVNIARIVLLLVVAVCFSLLVLIGLTGEWERFATIAIFLAVVLSIIAAITIFASILNYIMDSSK